MNKKQMMAVILENAYFDEQRENADYQFTEAEQKRFYRAVAECRKKVWKMAQAHWDEEVSTKIYGD